MAVLRVKDENGNVIDIPAIKGDDYILTEEDKKEIADMISPDTTKTYETVLTAESGDFYPVAEGNNKISFTATAGLGEGWEIVSVAIKKTAESDWVDIRDMIEEDGVPYFINGRRTYFDNGLGLVCFGVVTLPLGGNTYYSLAEAGELYAAKIIYKL